MLENIKNLFAKPNDNELATAVMEGAMLVDVRNPGEFASGSVKGAVNIPLDKVQENMNLFKGRKAIVTFCLSGNRSRQAKSILEKQGIHNVINGGSWQDVNRIINS